MGQDYINKSSVADEAEDEYVAASVHILVVLRARFVSDESQIGTPRHLRAFMMQLIIRKTTARQLTLSERTLKEAQPQRHPITTSHWFPTIAVAITVVIP